VGCRIKPQGLVQGLRVESGEAGTCPGNPHDAGVGVGRLVQVSPKALNLVKPPGLRKAPHGILYR